MTQSDPTADVLDRVKPWLAVCGSCDAGLPQSCTHPEGDYRPIMADLADEVLRLRSGIVAWRLWTESMAAEETAR